MLSLELVLNRALARCPRKLEFFHGLLMEQEPDSERLQCLGEPRTRAWEPESRGAAASILLSLAFFGCPALDAVSSAHTWAQANWHTQTFASSLLSTEQLFL